MWKLHWRQFLIVMVLASLLVWPAPGVAQDMLAGAGIDDWARIQRQGRLVAGLAPDNPPFAFLTENMAIDGFDAAVMAAVADKLGVQVDMQELVFPSLLDALELGQVDAAIAALTVTEARSEEVDFTIPYYVGTEGILAAEGGAATAVNTVNDLANYRIGAQAGTVYVDWLRENLVSTDRLPAGNLVFFNTVDQAVAGLRGGEVDLLVLDNLTARDIASQGGYRLIGEGMSRQHYAIAVRKGSSLLEPLNDALVELQQAGVIGELVIKYLAVDQNSLLPIPTPAPPPTPTPVPCINSSKFVRDVTYDDTNGAPVVQPGQTLVKQWRLVNAGNCAWSDQFRVAFAGGSQLGGQGSAIGRSVAPGENVDITVNLVAPGAPGTYRSQWILTDAQGAPFGQPFWATFTVPGALPTPLPVPPTPRPNPPPPPPPPPPVPAPVIDFFSASDSKVAVGQCVSFYWNVTGNVSEVKIKRDGNEWARGLGVNGSYDDCDAGEGKHTYKLKAYGPGGDTSQELTVKFRLIPLLDGDFGG